MDGVEDKTDRTDRIVLEPIGRVLNGEHDVERTDWSRVRSTVKVEPALAGSLLGLEDYSHVIVLGWLHEIPQAVRERPRAYPAGDRSLPLQGAFALRGPRPNPISVTVCRLLRVREGAIEVEGLDLVDGTPILDIKPYVAFYDAAPQATIPRWAGG